MCEPNCQDCRKLKSDVKDQLWAFQYVSRFYPELDPKILVDNLSKLVCGRGNEEQIKSPESVTNHAKLFNAFNLLQSQNPELDPKIFLQCVENLLKREQAVEPIISDSSVRGESENNNSNEEDRRSPQSNAISSGESSSMSMEIQTQTADETQNQSQTQSPPSSSLFPDSSTASPAPVPSPLAENSSKRKLFDKAPEEEQENEGTSQKRVKASTVTTVDEGTSTQKDDQEEEEVQIQGSSVANGSNGANRVHHIPIEIEGAQEERSTQEFDTSTNTSTSTTTTTTNSIAEASGVENEDLSEVQNDFPISFVYSNVTANWTNENWMASPDSLPFHNLETLNELSDYLLVATSVEREYLEHTGFCFNGWNLGSEDAREFFFVHGSSIRFFEWNPCYGFDSITEDGINTWNMLNQNGIDTETWIGMMMELLRTLLTSQCTNIHSLSLILPHGDKIEAGALFPEPPPNSEVTSTTLPMLRKLKINLVPSRCENIAGVIYDLLKAAPNLREFDTNNNVNIKEQGFNWPLLPAFAASGKLNMIQNFLFMPDSGESIRVYRNIASTCGGQLKPRVFIVDLSAIMGKPGLWPQMAAGLSQLLENQQDYLKEFQVRSGLSWMDHQLIALPTLPRVTKVTLWFKENQNQLMQVAVHGHGQGSALPEDMTRRFSRIFPAVDFVSLKISKGDGENGGQGGQVTNPWDLFLENVGPIQRVQKLKIMTIEETAQLPWINKSLQVFPMVKELEMHISVEAAPSRLWSSLTGLRSLKIVFKLPEQQHQLSQSQSTSTQSSSSNSTNQISRKLDAFFTGFSETDLELLEGRREDWNTLQREFRLTGTLTIVNSGVGNPSIIGLGCLKVLDISFEGHFEKNSPGFPYLFTRLSEKFGFGFFTNLNVQVSLAKLISNDKPRIVAAFGEMNNVTVVGGS